MTLSDVQVASELSPSSLLLCVAGEKVEGVSGHFTSSVLLSYWLEYSSDFGVRVFSCSFVGIRAEVSMRKLSNFIEIELFALC